MCRRRHLPATRSWSSTAVNYLDCRGYLSLARYVDGCTQRKCGWLSCSIGVVVSSMRLRTRKSRSVFRASAREQRRTSWILRTPSACRPCSVSTGPRCTSASQRSCSCSGDICQVYNASEFAYHFARRRRSNLRFECVCRQSSPGFGLVPAIFWRHVFPVSSVPNLAGRDVGP